MNPRKMFEPFKEKTVPFYEFTEVELERIERVVERRWSEEELDVDLGNGRFRLWWDVVADGLRLQLERDSWQQALQTVETVTYPETWWDAVKMRFAPAWWLRRYPASLVQVRIDSRVVYPMMDIALPDRRHFVKLVRSTLPPKKVSRRG